MTLSEIEDIHQDVEIEKGGRADLRKKRDYAVVAAAAGAVVAAGATAVAGVL